MSTADHSPTVRRARELLSLQKWPHADHDLRIMWAHSDLDHDDGLVLFSIARQDYDLGSGSWKAHHQTQDQDERLGVCPNFWIHSLNGGVHQCSLCYDSKRDPPYLYPTPTFGSIVSMVVCTSALFAMTPSATPTIPLPHQFPSRSSGPTR
jgi:hypothetical protein